MRFPIRQLAAREFPPQLREIPDAPARLYIRGSLPAPEHVYLGIVGSRRATQYGQRALFSLVSHLAGYPIVIVSGMAWGTDANAHKAALETGLPTVAVLPSGLSESAIYPSMNRPLAREILGKGGALISENEPDFKPRQYSFAERNRIVAGLSRAVLIVEASEKSGTLITARLALDYNREVLVVPHELERESGRGCNDLIHAGATLVRNAEDILEALGFKPKDPVQRTLPTDLTAAECAVMEALTEALVRDEVIDRCELTAQEANIALSSLAIRGLIVERLGKIERV